MTCEGNLYCVYWPLQISLTNITYKYHLVLWVRKEIDALDKFNKHCVITPITIVDLPGPHTLLQIHVLGYLSITFCLCFIC